MEVCHAQARRFRKPPQLSASRVRGGSHSPRKPTSSAGGVSSMATSNYPKNSAATICVHAAPAVGFKACCLKSGKYDGSNRDDYFQGVGDKAGVVITSSLPGLTRQSILFAKSFLRRWMDTRVKPAYDECGCGYRCACSSFRGARSANPESITTIVYEFRTEAARLSE
jgi:hypothetical protein